MRYRWTIAFTFLLACTALAAGMGGASAQSATLIGNTGQTAATGTVSSEWDQTQAFTTGSHSRGYEVTSVTIGFTVAASAHHPGYDFRLFAANSSGQPTGSSLARFDRSGALLETGDNAFPLLGGGSVRLDPNTTYALLFDITAAGGNSGQDVKFQFAASGNEDAGGAAGWSIADTSWRRSFGATTWATEQTEPLRISISGSAVTTLSVHAALDGYFSGTATLSEVEAALRTSGQTYHQRLRAEVAAGRLHQLVPGGRTKWGAPGTESWGQVGFPGVSDPSLTCGGEPQPVFQGDDHGEFFWACTGDNRWVPVRRHRPGIDYTRDAQLVRPGAAGYNEECRYKDADGNPTPLFRAEFHPQDHPNPQLRGKPVRNADGSVRGTTIHGGNWDPLAGNCTTRGGP